MDQRNSHCPCLLSLETAAKGTPTSIPFMCSSRLMKFILPCQNQDALRSAFRRPATSQNNAGSKHPNRPRSVFRQFLGPGSEKRWYGDSHGGRWDRTANKIVQQFKETGHLIFTSTSAGDFVNTELLLQTVHSVNQINFYAGRHGFVSPIRFDK